MSYAWQGKAEHSSRAVLYDLCFICYIRLTNLGTNTRIQCSNWMSLTILGTEMIDREIKFTRLPIVPMTSRERKTPAGRPRSPQISKQCGEDDLLYKYSLYVCTKNEQRERTTPFPVAGYRSFLSFLEAFLFKCSTKTEFVVLMFSFSARIGDAGTGQGAPLSCCPTTPFSNTPFSFSKNTEMTDRMN